MKNTNDAQEKIIATAKTILDEVDDVDKITVRQIAERAGVGTGLINYHFGSKDHLLSVTIGDIMAEMIQEFTGVDDSEMADPKAVLKQLLKALYALAFEHEKLIRFTLKRGLLEGDMQTPLYLMPMLKKIFPGRDEMELRVVALQILYPIQITGINLSAFHIYSGIDLQNEEQRAQFIDMLIDNLAK